MVATSLPVRLLPGIPLIESPLFEQEIEKADFSETEARVARDLHCKGYAVIDFPDDGLEQRIDRIKTAFAAALGSEFLDPCTKKAGGDKRVQDAWRYNDDVRAIACNQHVLDLLSSLYGRQAFPFQTLNFPVGTQQPLHTDAVHFSSLPAGFMCGVWFAMEDIQPGSGPLRYLPGSHKWPMIGNVDIGRRGYGSTAADAQSPFHDAWDAMIKAYEAEEEIFLAKRGQASSGPPICSTAEAANPTIRQHVGPRSPTTISTIASTTRQPFLTKPWAV